MNLIAADDDRQPVSIANFLLVVVGAGMLAAAAAGMAEESRFGTVTKALVPAAHAFAFGMVVGFTLVAPKLLVHARWRALRYLVVSAFFLACSGTLGGLRFLTYLSDPLGYQAPEWLLAERTGQAKAFMERDIHWLEQWERAHEFLSSAPETLRTSCVELQCEYRTDRGIVTVTTQIDRSRERQGIAWVVVPKGELGVSFWEVLRSYDHVDSQLGLDGLLSSKRLLVLLENKASDEGFNIRDQLRSRFGIVSSRSEGSLVSTVSVIPLYDFMTDSMCRAIDAGCERLHATSAIPIALELLLGMLKFFFLGFVANEMLKGSQAMRRPPLSSG